MTARKCFKVITMTALFVCTVMAFHGMGAQSAVLPDGHQAGYTCAVTRISAGWNDSYVKLTNVEGHPRFALKWFRLPKGQEEAMIVKATEAMGTDQTLFVQADIYDGIFPQIQTMQLKQERAGNLPGEGNGFLQICRLVSAKSGSILQL